MSIERKKRVPENDYRNLKMREFISSNGIFRLNEVRKNSIAARTVDSCQLTVVVGDIDGNEWKIMIVVVFDDVNINQMLVILLFLFHAYFYNINGKHKQYIKKKLAKMNSQFEIIP